MHAAVYQNTDALAVVHTHPVYATVMGTLLDEIPRIHYLLALLGGPFWVAPYAPFGTEELARKCIVAMKDRCAVLLQNHGADDLRSNPRQGILPEHVPGVAVSHLL